MKSKSKFSMEIDAGRKRVIELEQSIIPLLGFDSTVEGKRSVDSPKTVTVRNISTSALTIFSVPSFTQPVFLRMHAARAQTAKPARFWRLRPPAR
jgi:hypothetical protein